MRFCQLSIWPDVVVSEVVKKISPEKKIETKIFETKKLTERCQLSLKRIMPKSDQLNKLRSIWCKF
jgi:hypothetical protein